MIITVTFFLCLVAGLFCIGGFMWSAMEQKPRVVWLLGAGVTLLVGLGGLLLHRS